MNCARVLWTLIVIIAHPTYGQLAWQKRTQMPNRQFPLNEQQLNKTLYRHSMLRCKNRHNKSLCGSSMLRCKITGTSSTNQHRNRRKPPGGSPRIWRPGRRRQSPHNQTGPHNQTDVGPVPRGREIGLCRFLVALPAVVVARRAEFSEIAISFSTLASTSGSEDHPSTVTSSACPTNRIFRGPSAVE